MAKKIKAPEKNIMEEIADYSNDKSGLLFIVANPLKDEILVSFGGKNVYSRFPKADKVQNNVLVQMMSKSAFKESMNEFLMMIKKASGINEVDGLQMFQVVGGAIQSMVKNK